MRIHHIVIEQIPRIAEVVDTPIVSVIGVATVSNVVSTIERRAHVHYNRVECVLFLEIEVCSIAYRIDGYRVIDLNHRTILLRLVRLDIEEGTVDVEHQIRRILDNPALFGQCGVAVAAKGPSMVRLDTERPEAQRLHRQRCHLWDVDGVVEEQRSIAKNHTGIIDNSILHHLIVTTLLKNDTMVLPIQLRRNLVGRSTQNETRNPTMLRHKDVVVTIM